jgi:hypothetical protein
MRKFLSRGVMTITLLFPFSGFADGFGPGFSSTYEFRSESDRAVRAGVLDLMERKAAGMFQAPIYNSTYTTNIAGDQINCDVVATTIGNSGSSMVDGQSGAPSVLNSPNVGADATGNLTGGEPVGPLNAGSDGGSNSIQTDQQVAGSTLTSSVGTADVGGVTGDVGGSRSSLEQESSNEQSIAASPLNSSVTGSSACSWD